MCMIRDENKRQLNNFMNNIAFLRKRTGLTKNKMAEILHIGIKSLNKIERGKLPERLSVEVVYRAADYFHIAPDELFVLSLKQR